MHSQSNATIDHPVDKINGAAALTPDDLRAYQEGRLTLADLAARSGTSKQNVSKYLRRRGIGRDAVGGGVSTTSPTKPIQTALPEQLAGYAQSIAISTALATLEKLYAVSTGTAEIGPSGLKALAGTLDMTLTSLSKLGVIEVDDPSGELTNLSIKVLTPVEEAGIRRDAEAGDVLFDEHGATDGPTDLSIETAGNSHKVAATTAEDDQAATLNADSVESSEAAGFDENVLHERLSALLRHSGAVKLRAAAIQIGAKPIRIPEQLIGSIILQARANPSCRSTLFSLLELGERP